MYLYTKIYTVMQVQILMQDGASLCLNFLQTTNNFYTECCTNELN